MSTAATNTVLVPARIVHWAGKLFGTTVAATYVLLAIEAGIPGNHLDPMPWSILVMLAGFVLAWWNGLMGGTASLAGIGCFYVSYFAATGAFPGSWVYPVCIIAALLNMVAWLLSRRNSMDAATVVRRNYSFE